jgi:two-component system phosphate regulon sensor histidine kinase PhoR
MVYNLLENAFKYADNGPQIKITLTEHPDYLLLAVKDSGPGIEEQHHAKIFDKFYRVPSGNVHTVKGYGLGLNYVAGVVKSHGGKINLESKPGNGATFEIKFPKKTY